ncbi:MAG: hypothetical protein ACKVZ0_19155 [Gemmatimonadales bacterium]
MKGWLVLTLAWVAGCADQGPHPHDEPASAKLFSAAGAELTPAVSVPAGQILVVEVRFYRGDGTQIVGLDADHSALLRFSPASIASEGTIPGQKLRFEVTGRSSGGAGTMTIGYGHGNKTDERTFGPFPVTVR